MKVLVYSKTLLASAAAITIAASAVSQAQDQPMPPLAGTSTLPADIVPGSPLADVVKMVQAGVDAGTINSYILNSPSAFNLDADKIIFLKDEGVPSELVNSMLDRDKILYAANVAPAPAPVSVAASVPDTAPPPAEMTVNYFYDTLSPYGSWVDVDGFGRCWRPTVVVYDPTWRPYGDRGHWVDTDYGWYWDSDYSWGATFHYGRWFHHARLGWCWYPDTEWAPSWVTWRSGGDYCGWAPLPPLAVFRPGLGFFYRGVSVAADFNFGLDADCFLFIAPEHFCDRRPRSFFAEPARVSQIFRQTTVINNFNVSSKLFVNRGISVEHISSATHRAIEPVHVGSLPNASRQGWRGDSFDRPGQRGAVNNNTGRNFSSGTEPLRNATPLRSEQINDPNASRRENVGQPASGLKPVGNQVEPLHSQVQNHPLTGGTGPGQPQNGLHETQPLPTRTITASTVPNRVVIQNDVRPNRVIEAPAANVPQPRPAASLEQRTFVEPSQPRIEPRPTVVEPVPRNFTPPAPVPAPAPSQPRSAAPAAVPSTDKDKQNH